MLSKYVFVRHTRVADEHSRVTFPAILQRDKHTCGYCGSFGNTVDHIVPKSRGGKETWGNCVTACSDCNGWKADRTPEEAGMELLWPPKVPNGSEKLQKRIWRTLENLENSEKARPVA
jgi:5-methylcytosine-specific restriction endonuclease McrA